MSDRMVARPLSPTDAHPQAANAATPISCMHPNAIQRHWAPAQATSVRPVGSSSSAGAAMMAYPTLPLCASIYSDAEGRELLPFPCAVSADSYRQMLLQRAPPAGHGSGSGSNSSIYPAGHSSASLASAQSYAAPTHIPLGPSDLSLLCDALLCNTSLTSLSLDHCALDTHALPALCTLLQQHPSLTEVSLAGNLLGLHPDSEDLRALFAVLASPTTLPHLAQLNLANNQFPPRSLEVFCSVFLRVAPSIQHVDWSENEVGLRGGWAVVDALRERCAEDPSVLAPVTRFRLECDDVAEHETSSSVAAGQLPQPNLAQTRASNRPRPAYWARVQQLLRENRSRADQLLTNRHQRERGDAPASHKQGSEGAREEKKQQQQSPPAPIESLSSLTARLPPLSSGASASAPGAAAVSSSNPLDALLHGDGSTSPPAFIPPALFHASLGRLVSELNRERAARFERSQQLDAALAREKSLQAQVESQRVALEEAARKIEDQARTLVRESGHRRELESSLQAARTKEASLVASHARQIASMQARVDENRAEVARLHGALARVRSEAEVERARMRGELRASAEVAATRSAQESAHAAALRDLERRVEQLQWEREHPALASTDGSRKAPFRPPVVTTVHTQAKSTPAPAATVYTFEPASAPIRSSGSSSSSSSRGVELSSQRADRAHVAAAAAASAAAASPALSASHSASTPLTFVPRPVGATSSSSSDATSGAAAPAQSDANRSTSSGSGSGSSASGGRTPLSIVVSSERGSIGKTWAAAATAAATAAAATKAAAGGSSPLPSGSPGTGGSAGGSLNSSPVHSPMSGGGWGSNDLVPSPSPSPSPTGLSPSRAMFSSGAPPLPAAVLTPTHSMQLLPHHIQSWQQPLPQPAPLKLKPKQRGN